MSYVHAVYQDSKWTVEVLNAIRLLSVVECARKDKAKVQYVTNKNKSSGARQAGSGHQRLKQIPVADQGKQRSLKAESVGWPVERYS